VVDEANQAILGGADASNRLVVRMEGDGLDLRVNGQRVASLSLAEPPADPRYGMVAVSGDGPVEARFRNLSVRALS
jgi:hypothetical protein